MGTGVRQAADWQAEHSWMARSVNSRLLVSWIDQNPNLAW